MSAHHSLMPLNTAIAAQVHHAKSTSHGPS